MATIYIVDDRPINRQFLVTLLGYSGHTLAEAGDGVEALALVRQRIPDLIILDIVMPNMDGREFVALLQSDPQTAGIPVIFYTATYRSQEARSIASACGVKWTLAKPSEPELILATVAQALGQQAGAPGGSGAAPPQAGPAPTPGNDLNERMTSLTNELLITTGAPGAEPGGAEPQLIHMQAMTLKLAALLEVGIDIGGERDPVRLVELYCRAAQDILTARYAAVGILDQQGELRYFSMRGIDAPAASQLEWPRHRSGALARALAERRPVRLNQVAHDPVQTGLPPGHPLVKSLIVVPLFTPSQTYGWLYVADRLGFEGFCLDDERIAVTIGSQFSLAFENIELYQRLRQHAAQLQQESQERLQAVEALRRQEQLLIHQSRQAAMGEMINNIAHQWRQPLNALGLLIQQLTLLYEAGESPRELDRVALDCRGVLEHMSQTIEDFRNFFRTDKERVPFAVNQVLARVLALLKGSFDELRVAVDTTSEGDPRGFGYPNEYAQVLLNILGNARDALAERRVPEPRITIRSFREKGAAVVVIGDNAGGMEPEVLSRIFEPYFSTKAEGQGTGVGLSICKSIIVDGMQGALTVRNGAEGAEFRIEVRDAGC